jgi:hypothetical protein
LTRDRRGFENTFLMHADRPGDRPRLLYWYRTAPGIVQGRLPLDEDAIRTLEEQHPDIDFDWPAILALAAAMTPEDEAPPPRPQQQQQRQGKRRRDGGPRESSPASARAQTSDAPREDRVEAAAETSGVPEAEPLEADAGPDLEASPIELPPPSNRLVEELAGREIGARLRGRYADIIARIQDLDVDGSVKDAWFKKAEAIDPELWMTPEAVLEGVRNADAQYEKLRAALAAP